MCLFGSTDCSARNHTQARLLSVAEVSFRQVREKENDKLLLSIEKGNSAELVSHHLCCDTKGDCAAPAPLRP
jgi:hypothetical protein